MVFLWQNPTVWVHDNFVAKHGHLTPFRNADLGVSFFERQKRSFDCHTRKKKLKRSAETRKLSLGFSKRKSWQLVAELLSIASDVWPMHINLHLWPISSLSWLTTASKHFLHKSTRTCTAKSPYCSFPTPCRRLERLHGEPQTCMNGSWDWPTCATWLKMIEITFRWNKSSTLTSLVSDDRSRNVMILV